MVQGCLVSLDGTYINVTVLYTDKPRYRNKKGEITTNTLAVCDRNMKFSYFLVGWEGSTADVRVLRDALSRTNGLKVQKGTYYLCDNGYANSEGFLTSYKGVRYHLKEWGPQSSQPKNARELFNLRHSMARNVIERAFGVMKKRWGILRSESYYPVKIQNMIIMACFLLHNFIRNEIPNDPIERTVVENNEEEDHDEEEEYIDYVDPSDLWNQKRDELANLMRSTRNIN